MCEQKYKEISLKVWVSAKGPLFRIDIGDEESPKATKGLSTVDLFQVTHTTHEVKDFFPPLGSKDYRLLHLFERGFLF